MTLRLALGIAGEDTAEAYLRKQGFRIVERNWRYKSHELDIICRDKKELVFVEVRTRTISTMTSPKETITMRKQRSIIKAAQLYLVKNPWNGPCRFDVIAILANNQTFEVEHIRHAFDTTHTLDSSHTAW